MACSCIVPDFPIDCCSIYEPKPKKIPSVAVLQPFASLIAWGIIDLSVTNFFVKYRGPLLIVSDTEVFEGPSLVKPTALEYYNANAEIMPRGVALAVVDLVDCRKMTSDDEAAALVPFLNGLYSWSMKNPRLVEPFEVEIGRGLFHIPEKRVLFSHF